MKLLVIRFSAFGDVAMTVETPEPEMAAANTPKRTSRC